MGKLRDQMISDLLLKNYSHNTIKAYLRCCRNLAKHYMRCPKLLEEEEIRAFLLHLKQQRKVSAAELRMHVAGIKFLYRTTLKTPSKVNDIPWPKAHKTLPEVLTQKEVIRILEQIQSGKHRAIITTAYAAGLRISEVCSLRASGDIDSERMLIHVRAGKGGKDRSVMLSPRLLTLLREYWKETRPTGPYLFPGQNPDRHITSSSVREVLNESQTKWISTRNGFLVPVRALSKKFQGKFLDLLNTAFAENKLSLQGSIRNLHDPLAFERLMKNLYRKKWVVYSKQPFGGPEQVFAYLGLYSHRVAISNHRLVELAHGKVTFLARDNQHPGAKRRVCVAVEEFIRRFLLHILPKGFVKIRHYGLMAPSNVNSKLETARSLLVQESAHPSKINSPCEDNSDPDQRTTETDPTTCPACQGKLIRRPLTILDQFLPAGMQGPTFFDSS